VRALLLAGGRGTRLLPYTTVLPKPLVPVGELPVMEILLRQLARHGVQDVIVSVGYLAGLIEAYFADGSRFGLRIRYQHEAEPRGTAGPLRLVEDWHPDEAMLIVNGDLLTDLDFGRFVDAWEQTRPAIQIGMFRRTEQVDLGVLDVTDEGHVTAYREKPTHHYDVSMGVYVIAQRAQQLVPGDARFDMPDLVRSAMERGEQVRAYRHTGLWLDIGRPDDHRRATELAAEHPERFGPEVPVRP
jgi:NDP-sugar pyrophosphorylase family protein